MTDYSKILLNNFLKIGEEFIFYSVKATDLTSIQQINKMCYFSF